jgi:hypothetical protein
MEQAVGNKQRIARHMSRGGGGALVVYAFGDTGRARCVARLGLPALRPGVRFAHVAVHSGAAVAHEDAREPFGPAPGTGVHAVSLEYVEGAVIDAPDADELAAA